MLGKTALEQGSIRIGKRADEGLARVERGAAQRLLRQRVHLRLRAGEERR
jgi:hypothetical protein